MTILFNGLKLHTAQANVGQTITWIYRDFYVDTTLTQHVEPTESATFHFFHTLGHHCIPNRMLHVATVDPP